MEQEKVGMLRPVSFSLVGTFVEILPCLIRHVAEILFSHPCRPFAEQLQEGFVLVGCLEFWAVLVV